MKISGKFVGHIFRAHFSGTFFGHIFGAHVLDTFWAVIFAAQFAAHIVGAHFWDHISSRHIESTAQVSDGCADRACAIS